MRSGYGFYIDQTNERVSKCFIFGNKASKKGRDQTLSFQLKWVKMKGRKELQELCLVHLCHNSSRCSIYVAECLSTGWVLKSWSQWKLCIHFQLIYYLDHTTQQIYFRISFAIYILWKYDIRFHGLLLFFCVFLGCCSNRVAMDYAAGVVRVSKDQSPVILHSKAIVPEKCDLLQY